MAEFILPVTKQEYENADSKFITFPSNAKLGDQQTRHIEIGVVDWDTEGVSMKVPVVVIDDGPDNGKDDKISFGVDKKAIWKGKVIYKAITGKDMPMKTGADGQEHPSFTQEELLGKQAIGQWTMTQGKKGGIGELVMYPKLTDILPA